MPAAAASLVLGGAGAFLAGAADAAPVQPGSKTAVPHHATASSAQLKSRISNALTSSPKDTPPNLTPAHRSSTSAAPSSSPTASASSSPSPSATASPSSSGSVSAQIIGGTSTNISTAPWMAQLWYYDPVKNISFFCGGTVVSPTKIVTAAHCVSGYDWHTNGAIITGTEQLPATDSLGHITNIYGGTLSGVWRQWNHSSFKINSNGAPDNDIAVLTLPDPISATPLPMTTAKDTTSYAAGTKAQLYGWGRTSSTTNTLSQVLQTATLPIDADSTCTSAYGTDFVAGDMVCAGDPGTGSDTGTTAACNGDSGSPLVENGRLVGVVSWGVKDCVAAGSYSVLTKASTYVPTVEPRIDDTDLSGDGMADLFARRTSDGEGFEYDSRGTSYGPRTDLRAWGGLNLVRQADLNRDGYQDLLLRTNGGTLDWYHLDTSSYNWVTTSLGSGWNTMRFMVVPGDLNGDGWPDLLAADSNGDFWLYPGTGKGTFGHRLKVGWGWGVFGGNVFGSGDFNNDGQADLLARDSSGNLWLYPGTGSATHPIGPRMKVGWGYHFTAYVTDGDTTGDGHPDLVARDSSGNLWLYPGTGSSSWPFGPRIKLGWGYNGYDILS